MAINRSSDSLSRCTDQYDSMFKINNHPGVKPGAVKDTMAPSKTEELKKEAFERLTSSKYLLLQQGFMKVGKFLFLSIALPPYLLLWGLSKIYYYRNDPRSPHSGRLANKQNKISCPKTPLVYDQPY